MCDIGNGSIVLFNTINDVPKYFNHEGKKKQKHFAAKISELAKTLSVRQPLTKLTLLFIQIFRSTKVQQLYCSNSNKKLTSAS